MKVLVLGSGAKDHAIAWLFSKSKLIEGLYVAPSNPGTASFAVNLPDVNPADKNQVLEACKKYGIDFVFIGTEMPLQTGVVDHLNKNGISTFGAPSYALKLEGDRKFAREFAARHKIPVPNYKVFTSLKDIEAYLDENKGKTFTIKTNEMSPSRTMAYSDDKNVLLPFAEKLLQKGPVLVEDRVKGIGITGSILVDNVGYYVLPLCSEYTNREHTDKGLGTPTGGMGAICPIPLRQDIREAVLKQIIHPTFKGLKEENLYYKGVLTFSIVLASDGPYLVDYHVRLNDPATQAMVPLIKNDFVELMIAMQNNTLKQVEPIISEQSSVCVVIASEGYPNDTKTGMKLAPVSPKLMSNCCDDGAYLFFGAVQRKEDGEIYTNGGRAATIVGVGPNIIEANSMAYKAIDSVTFDGSWYREDIGNKFFENSTKENR
jgi:phosphoribosylamine---glycine ligase